MGAARLAVLGLSASSDGKIKPGATAPPARRACDRAVTEAGP